jgi:hypothetical protein
LALSHAKEVDVAVPGSIPPFAGKSLFDVSITTTLTPRRDKWYAIEEPTTPAPMTTTDLEDLVANAESVFTDLLWAKKFKSEEVHGTVVCFEHFVALDKKGNFR